MPITLRQAATLAALTLTGLSEAHAQTLQPCTSVAREAFFQAFNSNSGIDILDVGNVVKEPGYNVCSVIIDTTDGSVRFGFTTDLTVNGNPIWRRVFLEGPAKKPTTGHGYSNPLRAAHLHLHGPPSSTGTGPGHRCPAAGRADHDHRFGGPRLRLFRHGQKGATWVGAVLWRNPSVTNTMAHYSGQVSAASRTQAPARAAQAINSAVAAKRPKRSSGPPMCNGRQTPPIAPVGTASELTPDDRQCLAGAGPPRRRCDGAHHRRSAGAPPGAVGVRADETTAGRGFHHRDHAASSETGCRGALKLCLAIDAKHRRHAALSPPRGNGGCLLDRHSGPRATRDPLPSGQDGRLYLPIRAGRASRDDTTNRPAHSPHHPKSDPGHPVHHDARPTDPTKSGMAGQPPTKNAPHSPTVSFRFAKSAFGRSAMRTWISLKFARAYRSMRQRLNSRQTLTRRGLLKQRLNWRRTKTLNGGMAKRCVANCCRPRPMMT